MTGDETVVSRLVARLAWDEVARRMRAGEAAILPIGAGAKQHGLHMPMGTDALQAEWFALRLAERAQALVWPVLAYGHYPAFGAYPGTVSIASGTFEALVRDIVADLRRFNPRALFVVDTGLSTIAPVARAIAGFTGAPKVHHVPVYAGRHFSREADTLRQQARGSHADEIETSVMLAIAPDLVDMASAAKPPAPSVDFAPSGSFGDPSLATREKGDRLVRAILDDIEAAADLRHS